MNMLVIFGFKLRFKELEEKISPEQNYSLLNFLLDGLFQIFEKLKKKSSK